MGKAEYRRRLVCGQSARLVCGYVYANAGEGESTTDLVFNGHNIVAENGALLAERRFATGLTVSEVDVERLDYCLLYTSTLVDQAESEGGLDQHESRLIRAAIEFLSLIHI